MQIQKRYKIIGLLTCCLMLGSGFLLYNVVSTTEGLVAEAEDNEKEYKWTKKIVDKGTTIDAAYLWPDEENPSFTAIYRDGEVITEEKMVTVTEGSVYHFRGTSDTAVLYTEVYVGTPTVLDVTSGECGTWYNLLPSAIRTMFETEGWIWENGWEYTGRAYLDTENRRVLIKEDDPTAVLYGMGLYLDDKYNYSENSIFTEDTGFTNKFGTTDNLFASALEYYYTRGGELQSACPDIYSLVANAMSESEGVSNETVEETTVTPEPAVTSEETSTKNETTIETTPEPSSASDDGVTLVKKLVKYANKKRAEVGLSSIKWNKANNANTAIRVKEITQKMSQTRPNGKDAFTVYTDAVQCETRMSNVSSVEDIFNGAETYFYMKNLKSINCAMYKDKAVLVFIW